jgi:hypothetical protein
MRKLIFYILSLSFLSLVVAYIFLPPKHVVFSEQEIKAKIAQSLPYELDESIPRIVVNTADIELRNDDKVDIKTAFDATGATLEGHGTANISSSVLYDKGRFYLSDIRREDVDFQLSQNSNETISDVTSTIRNILERETEEANSSGDPDRIKKMQDANNYVETKLKTDLLERLDHTLRTIPIYNISNQGNWLSLAALSMESVVITDNQVTAILSFQIAIRRIGSGVLFVLFLFSVPLTNFGLRKLVLHLKKNEK